MKPNFAIHSKTAVLENEVLDRSYVSIANGRITAVSTEKPEGAILDFPGSILLPGFIDLHTHGRMGIESKDLDDKLLRAYAATGTTALLPSHVDTMPEMTAWLRRMKALPRSPGSAKVLGAHLEGPFIDVGNRGGIGRGVCITAADDLVAELLETGMLRYMTISPAVPGAVEAIRRLTQSGVICVSGHSSGDERVFAAAADAGLKGISHWYNNNHRDQLMIEQGVHTPVLCDRALIHPDFFLEIICDLQHVDPVFLKLALMVKGPGRIAVISDSIAAAGLPDGIYRNHDGREYELKDGGVHEVITGGRFGSCVTQPAEFANLVERLGIPLPEAARMCALTPAQILGVDKELGSIQPGKAADLLLLDADTFDIRGVFIDGLPLGSGLAF